MSATEAMTRADRHEAIVGAILEVVESGEVFEHLEDLGGDFDVLGKIIVAALKRSLPDLTNEEVHTAFEEVSRRLDAKIDRSAELDSELEIDRKIAVLCDGLPDHMMIGEVVQLRADQGDEFALWLLANPDELEREVVVIPEGGIH